MNLSKLRSSRYADAVSVSLMLKKWTVGNPLGSCEHQQGPWKLWPLSGKLSSFDFPLGWAYLLIREGHWPGRELWQNPFLLCFPMYHVAAGPAVHLWDVYIWALKWTKYYGGQVSVAPIADSPRPQTIQIPTPGSWRGYICVLTS